LSTDITRREALRRAAILLGGTLAAPTIAGVLAGCTGRGDDAASDTTAWVPRTLTPEQRATVIAIAEAIIPTTDTPGAKDAYVDRFVDAMLTEHYPSEDRQRFLAGLARIEARSRAAHQRDFSQLAPEQQVAMVAELDRLAFSEPPRILAEQKGSAAADSAVKVRQGGVAVGPPADRANPADSETVMPDDDDVGPHGFFRTMKELAVVGYYTSEVGSTRELRVNPMTRYRDIPYTPGTPSWA
jgi:hypothetical protein